MLRKINLLLSLMLVLSLGLVACGKQDATSDNINKTVGEQVKYEIIGIDPGAGLMKATATVIEEYELSKWKLKEGSSAAMAAALKKAYDKQEPIIITGWTPHWKFSKFDLKYLEDPKNVYGDAENIHTIVRKGLKEEHPNAYMILDQFYWEAKDMEDVMGYVEEGMSPEEAAGKWINENQEMVEPWLEGSTPVQGDAITLVYVAWESEIASTHVVAKVLEDAGYKVTLQQVEAGPMWAGVATASADAMVAAWLPVTHGDYYNEYEDKIEDLGVNLEGTRIGLVVPLYMEIDSIEDLK